MREVYADDEGAFVGEMESVAACAAAQIEDSGTSREDFVEQVCVEVEELVVSEEIIVGSGDIAGSYVFPGGSREWVWSLAHKTITGV